ncbi:hypothetical protein A1O1_08799 [Capronia coronata CBS 617.96]|uniref:Uncharacterized protein n=1 Tax=Capronia coronata CBS 617.96 TaxID=1182541 RepID=W9Y7N5_9EURO|nr:uncharacterized protein A1O1_08799 [Capronia coronata CBS 617.96]EXJ78399.1 hypothetical protein A1O1_08799 [Capronia coronata CBS 617.96]
MDDSLYDTSWLLHHISRLTPSLHDLLTPSLSDQDEDQDEDDQQTQLSAHAEALRASLGQDRPRYEEEEEREKLGGLKQCTWRRLRMWSNDHSPGKRRSVVGRKRKRDDAPTTSTSTSTSTSSDYHGLIISLVYDKATYKFIIYTADLVGGEDQQAPTRPRTRTGGRPSKKDMSRRPTITTTSTTSMTSNSFGNGAVLLSKSSPSALKALTRYLADTFALTEPITPLKLPSLLIQTTLERYLTSIAVLLGRRGRATADTRCSVFESVIGTVRLTVSFAPPVAPSLKSLDVNVPSRTVGLLYRRRLDGADQNQDRDQDQARGRGDKQQQYQHQHQARGRGDQQDQNMSDRPTDLDFMATLTSWILDRTGLNIDPPPPPTDRIIDDNNKENNETSTHDDPSQAGEEDEREESEEDYQVNQAPAKKSTTTTQSQPQHPPMRISRISTGAYAISTEGRLKFAWKPVEMVDGITREGEDEGGGEDEDEDDARTQNMVRGANHELLKAVLEEAIRQAGEGG